VTVLKAGSALTVLEPAEAAKAKVGVQGKWIHVSDAKGQIGYVAADYVGLETGETVEEPPSEPSDDGPLTVYVSSAAPAGLRMRSRPNTDSEVLKVLPMGTALTVLDGTRDTVGDYNKWLKVRDPEDDEGYVAAWYVHI
jgi:uncharacterized protein YgiM (DUF1202 family)